MAMGQQHLNKPPTIHPLVHQYGVPMIEIASYLNRFGMRCSAIEVDRLERIPGRINIVAGAVTDGVHTCLLCSLVLFSCWFSGSSKICCQRRLSARFSACRAMACIQIALPVR